MVKTREINEKLNKEELFNENSWNQETVTLLNLNNIQENECALWRKIIMETANKI